MVIKDNPPCPSGIPPTCPTVPMPEAPQNSRNMTLYIFSIAAWNPGSQAFVLPPWTTAAISTRENFYRRVMNPLHLAVGQYLYFAENP